MPGIPQIHHGMTVADIEATKTVLRELGFSEVQPGAPEPLVFRNIDGDPVGQMTAGVLADEYRTHFVENPETGQQIDLIEVPEQFLAEVPAGARVQGDMVIGIPAGPDPLAAYARVRAVDAGTDYTEPVAVPEEDGLRFRGREGQEFILTRRPDPFAIVFYSREDFPRTRAFFEGSLGVTLGPAALTADGSERYRLEDVGGRIEFEVGDGITCPDFGRSAKRYPSANHYRLLHRDLAAVEKAIGGSGVGGFLLPPAGGFAFIYGPTNEAVELFDATVTRPSSEPSGAGAQR